MTIVPYGTLNTAAQIVPDLAVQIVPPQTGYLRGVPTNIIGVVGVASWGPVNSPVIVSDYADYVDKFGPMMNGTFGTDVDMGVAVAAAVIQGANNFRCVRVAAGSPVAASIAVLTNCITFTAMYPGTRGNDVKVAVSPGTAKNSSRVTISIPGRVPEVFDNIKGSGNARWVAMADAINSGQSRRRGPSQIVVASAGVGTTAPAAATYALTGGTNGTKPGESALIGDDTASPRTGMYALRNSGATIGVVCGVNTASNWDAIDTFGMSEGCYMIVNGPSGDTIAAHTTALDSFNADSYATKVLFGDWIYFRIPETGQKKVIPPAGFVAGLLANLPPQESGLNKRLYGALGTQKSAANQLYSLAELEALATLRTDVVTTPVPGGDYIGVRFGRNASSNPNTNGDPYTRLTNFIAKTLNTGMGRFVGKLQSPKVRREAKATLEAFLQDMADQDMLGSADGRTPFSVQIDDANNPPSRVAQGYMQADVKVQYLSVVEYFVVNVEAGQSVTITRAPVQ